MNNRKGFTIIEVLLAAVLLAAGLVTVFSMANRAVFAHSELFYSEMATRLADETLAQVKVRLPSIQEIPARLQGDFNDRIDSHSWQADITQADQSNLVFVTVTISKAGAEKVKEFKLSTYMIR